MKVSGVATLVAAVATALSFPMAFFNSEVQRRPPYDPDPIETPIPDPTPEPTPTPRYTGTVGMQLPVIFDEWWLRGDDKYAILSGPSLMENAEFRTNILMTWSGQVKFNMEFYSAEGVLLGTRSYDTYTLEGCSEEPCSGYYQINNAMTEINPSYYGLFAVKCLPTGGTGKIFFFATSIDNRSGDPTMYSQFRFAKDGSVWSEMGSYN